MKLFSEFCKINILLLCISMSFCNQSALAAEESTLTNIKLNQTANNPKDFDSILTFNHKVDYDIFTLPNPERIVIDLKDCRTAVKSDQINIGLCPVSKIRIGIQNGYDLRLVYDLPQHIKYTSLFVPSTHNDGGKLIIQFNNNHALIPTEIQTAESEPVVNSHKKLKSKNRMEENLNSTQYQQQMNSNLHNNVTQTIAANSSDSTENNLNTTQYQHDNDADLQSNVRQTTIATSSNNNPQNTNPVSDSSQQNIAANENSDGDEADMINQLAVIEDQNSLKRYSGNVAETADNAVVNSAPLLSVGSGNRPVIVVIDAGHGGHDPGATGPYGIHEKNVTLAIARDLEYLVDKQKGMHAVMTRDGDYYVGLRDRLAIARKDKGDIFIAIHADAAPQFSGEAMGASVYALSLHGASSEAARWIAEKENYSELGAVNLDNIPDQDNMLRSVLIDLSQTATISDSLILGKDVLHQLGILSPLHHNVVEQAPFMVLKSPDIPSILVETGFITTPYEEQHLADPIYQEELAHSLLNGIKVYFDHYAPPGTWLASNNYKSTPDA